MNCYRCGVSTKSDYRTVTGRTVCSEKCKEEVDSMVSRCGKCKNDSCDYKNGAPVGKGDHAFTLDELVKMNHRVMLRPKLDGEIVVAFPEITRALGIICSMLDEKSYKAIKREALKENLEDGIVCLPDSWMVCGR